MSDFEESLSALDARLEDIQKRGKAVVTAIGRARAAAKLGQTNEIVKDLDEVTKRVIEVGAAADNLSDHWRFDMSAYLSEGRFFDDLKAAAAEKGLALFENDGRIYCFPLLLRVDPKENAVKIGRKLERRMRPSELAQLLAKAQKRPQRFREDQFLQLLYRVWRRLAGAGQRGAGLRAGSRTGRDPRNADAASRARLSDRGVRPGFAASRPSARLTNTRWVPIRASRFDPQQRPHEASRRL